MNRLKLFYVLFICILVLNTTACGGGSSGGMSDVTNPADQGQDITDDPSESLPSVDDSEPEVVQPTIINPTWTEIADSRLDAVAYDWSPYGTPGYFGSATYPGAGFFAWSGGALDTKRNRLLIYGGGHGDYGGQEIYAFAIDSMTWSLVAEPEDFISLDADNCQYGLRTENNFPKSQHSYDKIAYIEDLDSLCDTSGSVGYKNCYGSSEMACYSFTTGEWSFASDAVGGTTAAGAIDPNTGSWWIVGGGGHLGRYDVTTGVWTRGGYDNLMALHTNKTAVIDTQRNLFVLAHSGYNGQGYGVYAYPLGRDPAGTMTSYKVSTTGSAPNYGKMGFAYDPISGKMVAWDGGPTVYLLDTETWEWSTIEAAGDPPVNPNSNGTFGRFEYIASLDKFILVNSVYENVYFLDLRNEESPTSFELTSATTGAAVPFTAAVGFKKGDIGGTPQLDLDFYQVVVKKRWNDGSVKHAVFSGTYASTSGEPSRITVSSGTTTSVGSVLTESDIIAAAPKVSVDLASLGRFELADLLGSPVRIWLQGPAMIEAHYVADMGADPSLTVKFHVRLYADGTMRVRAIVENGTLDKVNEAKDYLPEVRIDGELVFDNNGQALTHYAHTRWSVTGWIGRDDPQITVAHDTAYLEETQLVPNYWKNGPSAATLDRLYQSYAPMEKGDWTTRMGTGGYQAQIGLLPKWDALYVNSGGDARAFRSVLANSESLNSYPIVWADSTTDQPIVVSDWPNWTYSGPNSGGNYSYEAGQLSWELNHHPSGGYLAYLLTGDYYYLETMQYQSALLYLSNTSSRGDGEARTLGGETRGKAWSVRTLGQLAGIAPPGPVTDGLAAVLSSTLSDWESKLRSPDLSQLGYFSAYGAVWPGFAHGNGQEAPWMQHFWMQSLGYITDLEPLAEMTNLVAVRDHLYQGVVGILGANGPENYCFNDGAKYTIKVSPVDNVDPTLWYDSWGEVYEATFGSPNTNCGNTLNGYIADAETTYWGNLLPAIAYAVEDGAPGAQEAWDRLTGADNWHEIENAGFEDIPIWGIVPRGWE